LTDALRQARHKSDQRKWPRAPLLWERQPVCPRLSGRRRLELARCRGRERVAPGAGRGVCPPAVEIPCDGLRAPDLREDSTPGRGGGPSDASREFLHLTAAHRPVEREHLLQLEAVGKDPWIAEDDDIR